MYRYSISPAHARLFILENKQSILSSVFKTRRGLLEEYRSYVERNFKSSLTRRDWLELHVIIFVDFYIRFMYGTEKIPRSIRYDVWTEVIKYYATRIR